MAPQGTKRASLTSASQPLAKKPTPVRSSSPSVKKPITAQFLTLKTLPSRRRSASVRDLFEEEMDNRHDKNNNDDKTANDNFSLEGLNNDDDIQFTLFDFK